MQDRGSIPFSGLTSLTRTVWFHLLPIWLRPLVAIPGILKTPLCMKNFSVVFLIHSCAVTLSGILRWTPETFNCRDLTPAVSVAASEFRELTEAGASDCIRGIWIAVPPATINLPCLPLLARGLWTRKWTIPLGFNLQLKIWLLFFKWVETTK